MKTFRNFFIICILVILASCGHEALNIDFGNDVCSFCRMVITDPRYGSAIQTKKGKCFKFDSIECLVQYVREQDNLNGKIKTIAVSDYAAPGNLINASTAVYLQSPSLPSPMGANITGFRSQEEAEKTSARHEGFILKWDDLLHTFAGAR